jgi:hypothetical protein
MSQQALTTMSIMDTFLIAQPSEKLNITFLITGFVLCTVPAMTFIAGMAWKQHTKAQELYEMQKYLDFVKKDRTELRELIQVNEGVIYELNEQLANNDVLVRNLVGNLNLPSTSDVGTQISSKPLRRGVLFKPLRRGVLSLRLLSAPHQNDKKKTNKYKRGCFYEKRERRNLQD